MSYKFNIIAIIIIAVILLTTIPTYSQTINRYIFPFPNRKNDSQIRVSPLFNGYHRNKALEFSYEPMPTESMKEKAKSVTEEYSETESINFLNEHKFINYYEPQSNLLKELESEAKLAIKKQQENSEKELLEIQKNNIASYTAKLKAKKSQTENKNINETK